MSNVRHDRSAQLRDYTHSPLRVSSLLFETSRSSTSYALYIHRPVHIFELISTHIHDLTGSQSFSLSRATKPTTTGTVEKTVIAAASGNIRRRRTVIRMANRSLSDRSDYFLYPNALTLPTNNFDIDDMDGCMWIEIGLLHASDTADIYLEPRQLECLAVEVSDV